MKRSVLPLLSATVFAMLFFGCVKNTGRPLPISEAQSWFNEHVANLSPETPNPNPRTTGAKSPDWASARSIQIFHGPAILVPVKYERPFYTTGNFSGDKYTRILPIRTLFKHPFFIILSLVPDINKINTSNEDITDTFNGKLF